jgi:hypothetical protein
MVKTSERFSFTGYSFKTWAIKNKDFLKGLATLVLGAGGLAYTFTSGLSPVLGTFLSGIGSLVFKLIVDSLDYFQSE